MTMHISTLESDALKLSMEERVRLADHLLASVGTPSDVEAAWAAEIDRRLADIESGDAALVPLDEAITALQRAIAHQRRKPGFWHHRA